VTATRPPMLAADHIRELVRTYTTTERVDRLEQNDAGTWKKAFGLHTVTHASLLDQLEEAITTAKATDEPGRGGGGSKPAARLDALAALEFIDSESRIMAAGLGIELLPLRKRLLAISGLVGSEQHGAVRKWWHEARVNTGWDSRPYRPRNVPCPIEECEQRGGLVILLAEYIGYCTHCRTEWDAGNIGLLGEWVTWAAEHLAGPRHWTADAEGFPTECTECLHTRDAMTERAMMRAQIDKLSTPRHAEM
jgi:hypothetical protein